MRGQPGDEVTEAEMEIYLSREDMLMLSTGRSFDREVTLETDDGTVVDLTVTLTGRAAR